MRVVVALLIYAVSAVLGTLFLAATDTFYGPNLAVAVIIFLGGIIALDLARTPTVPWRAIRLAESFNVGIALLLLFTFPFPPAPKHAGNIITLVSSIVIAVSVSVVLPRSRTTGLILVSIPALFGLYAVAHLLLSTGVSAAVTNGPAVVISMALVLMLQALWIGAALLARPWMPRAELLSAAD